MNKLISLEQVRWNLAIIWFVGSGFLVLVLIAQSFGGAYALKLKLLGVGRSRTFCPPWH